jgi:tRNA (mo5U34)-methyltransferase
MSKKTGVYAAANNLRLSRDAWYDEIKASTEFQRLGGKIYPYDITAANLDPIFSLFEATGFIDHFESEHQDPATVCDIGCANGDLSLAFSQAGFKVTAIDYSFKHDQAPYVVSALSKRAGAEVAVIDLSVDGHFTFADISSSQINSAKSPLPKDGIFDLVVCVGLLYHLRNPFAFMESLAKVSRYAVIGTHIFTHTPGLRVAIQDSPMAYLIDVDEVNSDPTNYWMFSQTAFVRLATRCGFQVLGNLCVPNNDLGIGVPDRLDLGIRSFLMLKSVI